MQRHLESLTITIDYYIDFDLENNIPYLYTLDYKHMNPSLTISEINQVYKAIGSIGEHMAIGLYTKEVNLIGE